MFLWSNGQYPRKNGKRNGVVCKKPAKPPPNMERIMMNGNFYNLGKFSLLS